MNRFVIVAFAALFLSMAGHNIEAQNQSIAAKVIPADTYGIGESAFNITLIGHASLMFEYKGKVIYVDPYSNVANYNRLPKADLILLTHEHPDHLDSEAISKLKKADTHFIMNKSCNEILGYGDVVINGEKIDWEGVNIEAVPAYNVENKRANGDAYHPKGRGNGYILTFDNQRIYIAGDTENISEMKKLKGTIDIAFLPKNMPYTMNDEMFTDAVKKISPKILYPYHFSEFNQEKFEQEFKGLDLKLLVRPMSNK